MINEEHRYGIYFVNDVLMKDNIAPPDKEKSGNDYDVLNALYSAYKTGGRDGAKLAWKALRRASPHLDKMKKLWTLEELDYLAPPEYGLPLSEDGTAPFYAIYRKGLNIIYGKPGCGKTFVAIDYMCRLSLAYPKVHFVFTAGEGNSGIKPRVRAWEKHYGQQISNLLIYGEALPLLSPEGMEEFRFWTQGMNIEFIVIDTLARAMLGENENDTSVMGKLINESDNLRREFDCGILFVHHTNRMGYIRGSIALDGGADSMLKVVAEDDLHIVYNSLDNGGKNKHSEEAPALYFRKVSVELDDMKDSAVMMPSEKVIDDIQDGEQLTDNQMKILRYLHSVVYATGAIIAESSDISRATVFRNLKKLLDAGYIEKHLEEAYKITSKGNQSLVS